MIWMQTVAFGVTSQRDTAKAQQGHQHTQEVGFEEKEKRERRSAERPKPPSSLLTRSLFVK